MSDKAEINDPVDWAIIQSFNRAEKHILMLKTIISIVRESSDKKDKTIEARVWKLVEKKYLVKCDSSSIDTNHNPSKNDTVVKRRPGLYGLNKNFEFEYTGISSTSKSDIAEVPDDIRRNHTIELKAAIENWIKYFPKPTYRHLSGKKAQLDPATNLDESGHPSKFNPYSANIAACEQHLLFPDLSNHLPGIDCDACAIWEKNKKELSELDTMQDTLLDSITSEVERWLRNNVAFYMYEPRYRKIGYDLASCIFPLMMKYISGDKSEIEFFLSSIPGNLMIKMSSLDPKLILDCINAHRKDKCIAREELAAFSMIIESILQKKGIVGSAEKIMVKTRELELERSSLVSELEKALLYTSYPGSCQYLK